MIKRAQYATHSHVERSRSVHTRHVSIARRQSAWQSTAVDLPSWPCECVQSCQTDGRGPRADDIKRSRSPPHRHRRRPTLLATAAAAACGPGPKQLQVARLVRILKFSISFFFFPRIIFLLLHCVSLGSGRRRRRVKPNIDRRGRRPATGRVQNDIEILYNFPRNDVLPRLF